MEISINRRNVSPPKSVVWNTHGQVIYESGPLVKFVAEVYEDVPKDIFCGDCGFRTGRLPVFRCSGIGFDEWSKAHALLDLLFVTDYRAKTQSEMETWLFSIQDRQATSFFLRSQIRNKGLDGENSRQSFTWDPLHLEMPHEDRSPFMVPKDSTLPLKGTPLEGIT
jgi:hypothetical protein